MKSIPPSTRILGAALIVLLSVIACVPLVYGPVSAAEGEPPAYQFHNLIHDSHEKLHYIIRLSELTDSLRHDPFTWWWARNLDGGHGYPFFAYYAPLAYAGAAVWHGLGLDLFAAWKVHVLLMTLLSGWGAFLLGARLGGSAGALTATALYLAAPYRIGNFLTRGNVAEFTAMAVLPWLVWAAIALWRKPHRAVPRVVLVVTVAAMLLSHNLSALFTALAMALWALFLVGTEGWRPRRAATLLAATFLGAVAAAYFWLPALVDLRHVEAAGLTQTFSETGTHVVSLRQFFDPVWGFGLSVPGPDDGMSFTLGPAACLALLVAIACAAIAARGCRTRHLRIVLWGLFGATALAMLLMMIASVWNLPLLRTIQFPWRLLMFASLSTALAGAAAVGLLAGRFGASLARAAAAALVLVALAQTPYYARVPGYFPMPAQLYRPEETRQRPITTNIGEFRPRWVAPSGGEAPPISQRRIVAGGETLARIRPDDVTSARFRLESGEAAPAEFEVHYYPGWTVRIDGESSRARPSARGMVEFDRLTGTHNYELLLRPTPARRAGEWLSLAALILLAAWLRPLRPRAATGTPPPRTDPPAQT